MKLGEENKESIESGVVLLVAEDQTFASESREVLKAAGYDLVHASTLARAREILHETHGLVDMILLDPAIAQNAGLTFLAESRRRFRELPIAVATQSRDLELAIFALKHSVFDYLLQPISREALLIAVETGVERAQMARELSVRRALDPALHDVQENGVFASPPMRNIAGVVEQVKDSSVPVMILGETGTGKEVVARLIHRSSKRRDRPFVTVNCASMPRELAESELFGHEKGSFTGADVKKAGRFAEADSGTIFLDEVGELDPTIQAKLLRVLQEGEVVPLGGQPRKLDMRVLVATNRDLADDVRQGRFRADLFFRLNVITVRLPPLRERREEIPVLAVHLLDRFVARDGIPSKTLSADAIALLEAQPWPGNVRELESTLKRSALLSRGRVITAAELQLNGAETPVPAPMRPEHDGRPAAPLIDEAEPMRKLSEYERELMMRALAETRGNVSAAARRLGIGRSTFYRRAERYNLPI